MANDQQVLEMVKEFSKTEIASYWEEGNKHHVCLRNGGEDGMVTIWYLDRKNEVIVVMTGQLDTQEECEQISNDIAAAGRSNQPRYPRRRSRTN
jgi:hypothetical protein